MSSIEEIYNEVKVMKNDGIFTIKKKIEKNKDTKVQ